jgi:general secretion pathway protein F
MDSSTYRDLISDLRTLVASGIPIREAVEKLRDATSRARLKLVEPLLDRLHGGETLAEAMAAFPRDFPPQDVALISIGESSGKLDEILATVLESIEERKRVLSDLARKLAWPCFSLFAAVAFLPLYLLVMGQTRLYWTIQFSVFAPLILLVAFFVWGLPRIHENSRIHAVTEAVILSLPFFGSVFLERVFGRVLGVLGLVLEAGGALDEAIRLASGALPWSGLRRALLSTRECIRRGQSFSQALRSAEELHLQPQWVDRIAVGEKSGTLDGALKALASDLESASRRRLGRFFGVLPVLVILLVGAIVLLRVFALFGKMYGGS